METDILIKNAISQALGELGIKYDEEVSLEHPADSSNGDISSNVAMKLFGLKSNHEILESAKNFKSPLELAEKIVEALNKNSDLKTTFSKIESAKPGFINFTFSTEYLIKNALEIIEKKDRYGSSEIGKGKTVVVDYSAPNIAKNFSIGHLRSTIIGQSIYNIYSFLGYKVVGDNHLGDWGTQFGKIIDKKVRKNIEYKSLSLNEIEMLYVEFHKDAEANPELENEGREWFNKLENGDKQATEIWQAMIDISIKEFAKMYDLLNVKIDYAYGESFYKDLMPSVIAEAKEKGLVKESEGAQVIEVENMPPLILVKSDGSTTYHTRDLATIKFRIKEWNPSLIIYEVGSEQVLHFKQLFYVAEKLGWAKDLEFYHLKHGLILFAGRKMSSRKGQVVKLQEIINESIEQARKIISDSETKKGLNEEEKDHLAKAVGVGAVKYFDLSHHPATNINFDLNSMLDMHGNTGPYLQYTYARTNGILRKADSSYAFEKDVSDFASVLGPAEAVMLRQLNGFEQVVAESADKYSPNLIANYIFELAQRYNAYYNQNSILNPESENKDKTIELRIFITQCVGQVLKNGLVLLGIETLEKM